MEKNEFLWGLGQELRGLPPEDIERSVDYYREMIEDRMEDGLSEEEAVAALGPIEDIRDQILGDTSLPRLVKERVRPRRKIRAWEIVLLVLGSPVWLPLLMSVVIVLLSVYATLWAVVLTLYAADLTVAAGGLAGIFGLARYLSLGEPTMGILYLGVGLVCMGLAIFLFFGFNQVTKGLLWVSKKGLLALKGCLVRKEAAA